MTAESSQKLADALRAAGLEKLAQRAELDEFHDYLSPHDLPAIALGVELAAIINGKLSLDIKTAAKKIRQRHLNGDFDATDAESDAWAASPEGQEAFARLIRGE